MSLVPTLGCVRCFDVRNFYSAKGGTRKGTTQLPSWLLNNTQSWWHAFCNVWGSLSLSLSLALALSAVVVVVAWGCCTEKLLSPMTCVTLLNILFALLFLANCQFKEKRKSHPVSTIVVVKKMTFLHLLGLMEEVWSFVVINPLLIPFLGFDP